MILLDSTLLGEWSFDEIHTVAGNGRQTFGDQVNAPDFFLGEPRIAVIFGEKPSWGAIPAGSRCYENKTRRLAG